MGMLFASKDPSACGFSMRYWNYHNDKVPVIIGALMAVVRFRRTGWTWGPGAASPIDYVFFACKYWYLM